VGSVEEIRASPLPALQAFLAGRDDEALQPGLERAGRMEGIDGP
jgi:hypothetical protein